MGATARISENIFGTKTRLIINPVTDTIATTPTLILKNNPDRLMWMAVNLSPNTGYLAFGNDVASDKGIYISSNGGMASVNVKEDAELVAHDVWAINATAAGTWYIIELVSDGD